MRNRGIISSKCHTVSHISELENLTAQQIYTYPTLLPLQSLWEHSMLVLRKPNIVVRQNNFNLLTRFLGHVLQLPNSVDRLPRSFRIHMNTQFLSSAIIFPGSNLF